MVVGFLLALTIADVSIYVGAGISAATAADAAALAAAPVTFRPFGSGGVPRREAARLAEANGASVVSCRCPVDLSWRRRTVEVVVERTVRLTLFGRRSIRAVGRAVFEPTLLHQERS